MWFTKYRHKDEWLYDKPHKLGKPHMLWEFHRLLGIRQRPVTSKNSLFSDAAAFIFSKHGLLTILWAIRCFLKLTVRIWKSRVASFAGNGVSHWYFSTNRLTHAVLKIVGTLYPHTPYLFLGPIALCFPLTIFFLWHSCSQQGEPQARKQTRLWLIHKIIKIFLPFLGG